MDSGPSETRVGSSPSHPLDLGGFAPGTLLADRYRIVARVGRGGMGEVYRADDLKLGQTVALKFLPPWLERDPAARDRLLAEVRSARTVSHPNVCRVYDVGEIPGSGLQASGSGPARVFLTMEYIDGEDLASLLRRIGRLPAAKALEIARQLCAGLAAAHDKGVLHRDLKPANVMIDGRGHARITDFGLALRLGDEAGPARAGQAAGAVHDVAGTVAYMAPERFKGTPATVQSDLYALGLILYETCTGKPAFSASTVREWERAHSDSTPTSPAALTTDVGPAVERTILRCLEKDPAKRPVSAAQVAASLPGGDPLAAALAAGETPSPELVAASGEEGTLPRWKAWAWLAACLVMLAAVPFLKHPVSLTEHVPFNLSPDMLRARAGDVLQRLGYPDHPADYAWWFERDDKDWARLNTLRPSDAETELRAGAPGPLRFCYRQSLASLVPVDYTGEVSRTDPPPSPGDVFLRLDLGGRLLELSAEPPSYGDPQPSSRIDWAALFDASGLGPQEAFREDTPKWWPESAVDVRAARTGMYSGREVRVEAAARAGRTVYFRLVFPWNAPPSSAANASQGQTLPVLAEISRFLAWGCLIALAIFARRNLLLGRGDRPGARTLAIAVAATGMTSSVFISHDPLQGTPLLLRLGLGLGLGLIAWVIYLGVEPAVRRTWPHLMITWTRLVNGGWRDALVGRAVLAGVAVGIALHGLSTGQVIYRLMDLVGGGPTALFGDLRAGRVFVGGSFAAVQGSLVQTLSFVGILLILRRIVRRPGVAWLVFTVGYAGLTYVGVVATRSTAISPWVWLVLCAGWALMQVWLLWKHGALALALGTFVHQIVARCPWTLDMSRWYAWRQWFTVAIIVALAVWGFKNVLGRQSAFPAGAMDE